MIKPPWAFSIWSDADNIYAELPRINGHQSHTVKVPNDVVGLNKLLILARSRNATSQIGDKGDPTQFQIEKVTYDPAMVRRPKEKLKFTPAQRINAREILRKMGLICLALLLTACQAPLR
jgi:hypothetical protein